MSATSATAGTIAVVGGTGRQGGGLVRAILDDPEGRYAVRVLTRDAGSEGARALAARGAEVVEADLDDAAALTKAFEGAHGAFVVTAYFAELTSDQQKARSRAKREEEQAANAARAAKAAGVRHVVWSTLEDSRPFFERTGNKVPRIGEYTSPVYDGKAAGDKYFVEAGVPTTFLLTPVFYELLFLGMGPTRNAAGELVLHIPLADRETAFIGAEDIGRTALAVFKAGDEYIGRTVGIAAERAGGERMAAMLTEVIGEKVAYQPVSWDDIRRSGALEAANGIQFAATSPEFLERRDVEWTRRMNPGVESFRSWMEAHRDALRALVS
jgi:uncharacterized protein YbjT (DUF2867 family)